MGLEAVKEEIIRNAKAQEEVLLVGARQETKKILDETEKKIAAIIEKSNTETIRIMDLIKRQEMASAELENKKILLEAKKQMISSVFSKARDNIEKLDLRKKEEFIKKLLEKAEKDIEVAKVYCNKQDVNLVKGYVAEVTDIIGGIIAENKDQTIRVDYSFDSMLQNIEEDELQSINKILFG